MPRTEIYVQEYIQVAHRLSLLPGKCQNIHGHSMLVKMTLGGEVNGDGLMINWQHEVLDFSDVKKVFREYLTDMYDHHLLLNVKDPYASGITLQAEPWKTNMLPGLMIVAGDPTCENIAKWIFDAMSKSFPVLKVEVKETETNGVSYCG